VEKIKRKKKREGTGSTKTEINVGILGNENNRRETSYFWA